MQTLNPRLLLFAVCAAPPRAVTVQRGASSKYQGLSIGKRLVRRLDEQIREEIVVLNTHPGAVGFYNRFPEYRRNKYVFEKHITGPEEKRPERPQSGGSGEKRPQGSPSDFRAKMFTPAGYRFPDEY